MELSDLLSDSHHYESGRRRVLDTIVNDIVDEVTLGLCFEMHRSSKLGTLFLDEMDDESQKRFEIVTARGVDVFGQATSTKKQYDCQCPNCHRSLAASRFAPHLEKCMGMGGNVTRVARRSLKFAVDSRMPSISKKPCADIDESDDNSNDNDWTYNANKKAKKFKKSGPQKKRTTKKRKSPVLEAPLLSSPSSSQSSAYDDDKKQILHNRICGVISDHTKKVCTRSVKCPQHTDEQRQLVRSILFQQTSFKDKLNEPGNHSEELRGMKTPSRLFSPFDSMPQPSPTDSCSTVASESSHKRKKNWAKKSKKKKKTPKLVPMTPPRLTSRHSVKYVFDSSSSSSFVS